MKAQTKQNFCMHSKSQITFFILFGFTIVLAVGILITMTSDKSAKKITEQTMTKSKTTIQVQPIKDNVNNCLKLTAKEALIKIGKQGGYLYQEQGGSAENLRPADLDIKYTEYDNEKTRYLINEPTADMGNIFFSTTPKYPWPIFPYTDTTYSDTLYIGYYGTVQLPALYRPAKDSLQKQLETYISSNTKNCMHFDTYPAFEITPQEPTTTMFIANETKKLATEEAVHFTMNWPIQVKDKTSNTTTTISEFGTTINVPFAQIYYNITYILNNEARNISYEPHPEGNFVAQVTPIGKNSIVTTKFANTFIDGQPYEFRFARHNRQPALHLITELKTKVNGPYGEIQDVIKLPVGATINLAGNKITFTDYTCSGASEYTWMPTITLTASDPDAPESSIQPNNNIEFKFYCGLGCNTNPINLINDITLGDRKEIQIIAQKTNDNTKKDSQSFYVYTYVCPP